MAEFKLSQSGGEPGGDSGAEAAKVVAEAQAGGRPQDEPFVVQYARLRRVRREGELRGALITPEEVEGAEEAPEIEESHAALQEPEAVQEQDPISEFAPELDDQLERRADIDLDRVERASLTHRWKDEDQIEGCDVVCVQHCDYVDVFETRRHFLVRRFGKPCTKLLKKDIDPRLHPTFRRIGPLQRADIWFKMRKKYLTASAIYPILKGGAKWRHLMNKKMGYGQGPTSSHGSRAMAHGVKYEDDGVRHYEKVTGNKVIPIDFGLVTHPTIPFLAGSPDGVVGSCLLADGTIGPAILEIKCPYSRKFKLGDDIPELYVPQVQLLMEINNVEEAHYFEYKPANPPINDTCYNFVRVRRNREWFRNRMLPPCRAFFLQWSLNSIQDSRGLWQAFTTRKRKRLQVEPEINSDDEEGFTELEAPDLKILKLGF